MKSIFFLALLVPSLAFAARTVRIVVTPSYPSYPGTPSWPSMPEMPSYPSYPGVPSAPSYPSAPSSPSYAAGGFRSMLDQFLTFIGYSRGIDSHPVESHVPGKKAPSRDGGGAEPAPGAQDAR